MSHHRLTKRSHIAIPDKGQFYPRNPNTGKILDKLPLSIFHTMLIYSRNKFAR